jgi:nicotinate phosphoribosyltransferase
VAAEDHDRDLVVPLVRGGELCEQPSPADALARARDHHQRIRQALPAEAWALSRGEPVLETVPS